MSKKLSDFMKNDKILVEKMACDEKSRALLEAFGIFNGAKFQLFYKDKTKMILKIGKTKLALSKKIADEIFVRL